MSNINGHSSCAPTETNHTLQNAAVANGNGTPLVLGPTATQVTVFTTGTDTPVFLVTFEVSYNGGSTYVNAFLENLLAAGGIGTLVNVLTNPTTAINRFYPPPGATHLRAVISGRATGTCTVTAVRRDA